MDASDEELPLLLSCLLNVTWHPYCSAVHYTHTHAQTHAYTPRGSFEHGHLAAMVTLGFYGVWCRIMRSENDDGGRVKKQRTAASESFQLHYVFMHLV